MKTKKEQMTDILEMMNDLKKLDIDKQNFVKGFIKGLSIKNDFKSIING